MNKPKCKISNPGNRLALAHNVVQALRSVKDEASADRFSKEMFGVSQLDYAQTLELAKKYVEIEE